MTHDHDPRPAPVLGCAAVKKAARLPRQRSLSYELSIAAKRLANRQRWDEVRDPENVPNRFTHGWYD